MKLDKEVHNLDSTIVLQPVGIIHTGIEHPKICRWAAIWLKSKYSLNMSLPSPVLRKLPYLGADVVPPC